MVRDTSPIPPRVRLYFLLLLLRSLTAWMVSGLQVVHVHVIQLSLVIFTSRIGPC
jgi:hypothetical protein